MAAARLLAENGDSVFISEIKDDSEKKEFLENLVKDSVVERKNIEIGIHTKKFLEGAELIVLSPGVSGDSLAIKLAEEMHIPIISELELGYSACSVPIIAVTGTSGKTTVTTLIGEMLREGGRDAVVCGNIGNPLSSEIKSLRKDSIVVLEVSSFQLEGIKDFKPKVSIILNISENHLDRHKDIEEYIALKARIFSNQDEDSIIFLNSKDKELKIFSKNIRPRIEFFDIYKDFGEKHKIKNENYLAAMSVVSTQGVDEDIMLEVISRFKGIEHRLEHVATIRGVDFINDSKATTVSSVEWALKSLDGRIRLIMGGKYKGGDFGKLKTLVENKVDAIIVIGEAAPTIKKAIEPFKDVIQKENLSEAIRSAFENAKKGDKILLSPGCSSFDMFKNYEERGRIFKEICSRL